MSKQDTILKFGKHKGSDIKDIPLKYLAWLLTRYEGTSLSKEVIEKEALRRGCSKRNGRWGIERSRPNIGVIDSLFGVVCELDEDFDYEDADYGDDPWIYHGIPNMD